MYIKIKLLILCLILGHPMLAQRKFPLAIKNGEIVPDISFKQIVNQEGKVLNLKDYRGKLIILDFWDTGCSSCIDAFPKMSKLQEQFKERIQILLVNSHPSKRETVDRIKATLEKYRKRTGDKLDLPVPVFDTILNEYFPHHGLPHLVWIDGQGRFLGATRPQYLTQENIEAILAGRKVDLPYKNDFLIFDNKVSILGDEKGSSVKKFIYRSVFTGYDSGMPIKHGARRNEMGVQTGLHFLNYSLWGLIRAAYAEQFRGRSASNVILEVMNPLMYQKHARDTTYLYCYDLIAPARDRQFSFDSYLAGDLKRSFNISLKEEKRMMNTLVLTAIGKIKSSAYQQTDLDMDTTSIHNFFHGISIGELVPILDEQLKMPFIDETGLSEKRVDIDLPAGARVYDKGVVVKALKMAGFEVKEEKRELEVVVITDK
jgi:thiol-disulfide isomerase/thioredoxin